MKRTITTAILIIFTNFTPTNASPLSVRCSSETSWKNQKIKVQIDIALPEKTDKYVSVLSRDEKDIEIIDKNSVGVGAIEITEMLGRAKEHHRHKFIVTRMPSDVNSLSGFYLVNTYVNSIRVEWWGKRKTFIYFDAYNNEVLRGTCR